MGVTRSDLTARGRLIKPPRNLPASELGPRKKNWRSFSHRRLGLVPLRTRGSKLSGPRLPLDDQKGANRNERLPNREKCPGTAGTAGGKGTASFRFVRFPEKGRKKKTKRFLRPHPEETGLRPAGTGGGGSGIRTRRYDSFKPYTHFPGRGALQTTRAPTPARDRGAGTLGGGSAPAKAQPGRDLAARAPGHIGLKVGLPKKGRFRGGNGARA